MSELRPKDPPNGVLDWFERGTKEIVRKIRDHESLADPAKIRLNPDGSAQIDPGWLDQLMREAMDAEATRQQPTSKQRHVFNDRAVPARITEYLGNGGLWNPDLMNHEAVRDLLIDARDVVEMLLRERAADETPACPDCNDLRMTHGPSECPTCADKSPAPTPPATEGPCGECGTRTSARIGDYWFCPEHKPPP